MHSFSLIHHQQQKKKQSKKMEAMKNESAAINTTFEPSSDVIQEEDCNTLLIYLPGFTKEQLKVQLTRSRDLKISGSRKLENNKFSSFQKDFRVPENCDTSKISAKFEEGILYVRQPKYKTTPQPLPPPPPAAAAKIDQPPPPTAKPTEPIEQTKDSAEKSADRRNESNKPTGNGSEITKAPAAEGGKKEEMTRKPAAEGVKKEEITKKPAEDKIGAAGKGGKDGVGADYNKLNAVSPAARLKAARQQMTNILLVLLVFAIGIYVGKLPWFSKRADELNDI